MRKIERPASDLRQRFILFLASKPANKKYPYTDGLRCACAMFTREVLTERKPLLPWWPFSWLSIVVRHPTTEENQQVWGEWDRIARIEPHTYGAFLGRMRDGVISDLADNTFANERHADQRQQERFHRKAMAVGLISITAFSLYAQIIIWFA